MTSLRRSNRSEPETNPPMFAIFLAALMILFATASPNSAWSAKSDGDITAMANNSSNPASRSFSAVAGPTPGKSSILASLSISSVMIVTSSSLGSSFLLFAFDFAGILSLKLHDPLFLYESVIESECESESEIMALVMVVSRFLLNRAFPLLD